MRLIKNNALCLRPSWPVLHAPRLKRPPFVWDHCNRWCVLCYRRYMTFVSSKFKIDTQRMYLGNAFGVIISSVQTSYPWITRGGDSAPNRQQSALSDGFQLLTSVVRVTDSLPSAVGSDWFQRTIRSPHGEIQCITPIFCGRLKNNKWHRHFDPARQQLPTNVICHIVLFAAILAASCDL